MKTIWKNVACRVWLIITVVVLALAIVVNILASTVFYNIIGLALGRGELEIIGEESTRFTKDFSTKQEARENGWAVSTEICEEGFTLLKNNNAALPLSSNEKKISVFGKNSVDMAVGGSGSGGGITAQKTIFDSLSSAGFEVNETLKAFYQSDASGAGRDSYPSDMSTGAVLTELNVGETPVGNYNADVWNSCADSDVALIVLTRLGGEGSDLPRYSETSHYLQISAEESALIEQVKSMQFRKVVLLLNTVTPMELKSVDEDDGIDAVLWIGYAGEYGIMALGEILNGTVTPSGKTVDIFAADFADNPTWNNFGGALGATSNAGGDEYLVTTTDKRTGKETYVGQTTYFVDYEESIYIGYRYYETAHAEALKGNYDGFNYDEEVVYPFGYGLSYTTFEWTFVNRSEIENKVLEKDTSITFELKVTNTGSYAGRDVIQLYVTPPYTYGGIEKSSKVLVGFAKTDLLQPGETSDSIFITVNTPYEFASYDYKGVSGKTGYITEKGNYTLTLGTDSHSATFTADVKVEEDIRYDTNPYYEDGIPVANLYTDNEDESLNSDAQLGTLLSRADFVGTWPQMRTSAERDVTDYQDWVASLKSTAADPNRPVQDDVMPTTGKDYGILLAELIGLNYDDELWELFMDQLTVDEMTTLVNNADFHTEAIQRLGVFPTSSSDGPVGFINFMPQTVIYGCCAYPSEVVIASTWNVDRLYDMGVAVGNEGLVGNEGGDGAPYSGLYAPGVNIHRSPFSGRNYEYYSEDAFLSGVLAASFIEGAAEKGVYLTVKHFALNDQETHRQGVLTWVTEQTMREVYLKPFEIAVTRVNAYAAERDTVIPLAVMSSFNRIGSRWAGGDYRLLTTILREEWGFKGLVISDYNTCTHMIEKDMFYAGGDLNLQSLGIKVWSPEANSASDVAVLRQAAKNTLYVVANSNAMRGDFIVHTPVWQVVMFLIDVVLALGFIVWGTLVIYRAVKKKS